MKKIFFTVGPSKEYPKFNEFVQYALENQVASLSHRGTQFHKLYSDIEISLKKLLSIPDEYEVFFLGSSIEAMERIIQNTVGSTSFHFVDGAFSQKAASIARDLQKNVLHTPAPEESSYVIDDVVIPEKAELLFITENDTSSGLVFPHEYIYSLRKKYPKVLIAVDLVSSAPYSSIDFSQIDMAFFSGQKGFGIPAGISMLIVSPRSIQKARELQKKEVNIGSFHSFISLHTSRSMWETPETPNVLAMHLLRDVLDDMLTVGIGKIRIDIDKKAEMLYRFFDDHSGFTPVVRDVMFRSPSTLVIGLKNGNKKLLNDLTKKGIIIGNGYGAHASDQIRIANFPSHTLEDVEKLLLTIQTLEIE